MLNNPLSYTDPSGFFFSKIFKAIGNFFSSAFRAIGGIIKKALANPIVRAVIQIIACGNPAAAVTCAPVSAGLALASGGGIVGALKAAAMAFAMPHVWHHVGTALETAGVIAAEIGHAATALVKGAVHGIIGGAAAVAQGGSFIHGFAANAIGAAAGVVSDAVSMGNDVLDTAIVAAAGCAGAVFSGGKCGNGAVTAAFANMYNKLMHRQGPAQYPEGHQCRTNPSFCGGAATESVGPLEFLGGVRAVFGLAHMAARGLASGISALARGFCSFDGETLVQTSRGLVPIKDIEPGRHLVWSLDDKTGEMGWKPVTARWVNPHADRVILTIAHNDNDATVTQTLITTREHPFFVKGAQQSITLLVAANENPAGYIGEIVNGGAFITADRLEAGDRLMAADGTKARLVSVAIEDTPIDAYNLTVADFHTFYVRGPAESAADDNAPAVWVHNCNAARREAMRQAGIPTSQQPVSISKNSSGYEYSYDVPTRGGGTQRMSVQQQTLDRSHQGQPHWEAGRVKMDGQSVRMNRYGRPMLQNEGKVKINY